MTLAVISDIKLLSVRDVTPKILMSGAEEDDRSVVTAFV